MAGERRSYEVLARRYRPQTFADLVGQEAIAATLGNAIRLGRVAHAYLFTGSRGVGKTSAARIFAKALNCAKGPTPEPCNECESCRLISTGNDVDVIEIDGASNNGVDEVRELRESAIYAAARSRFRIFIIDEVHMLTAAAFNALLKILEEPPAHVKFIFATTDPQKVIETVRSRCQRFDFRRISPAAVAKRLEEIAAKEGYAIETPARDAIVRSASGGLRDAQSLLDQLIAYAGDERTLTTAMARDVLGVVPAETVAAIVRAVARRDASEALDAVDREIRAGRDPVELLDHTAEHVRAAVRLHVGGAAALGETALDPAEAAAVEATRSILGLDEALLVVQVLLETRRRLARSEGRVVLELALIRLCRRAEVLLLDEALRELRSSGGGSGSGSVSSGPRPAPVPAAPPQQQQPAAFRAPASPPASRPAPPPPSSSSPSATRVAAPPRSLAETRPASAPEEDIAESDDGEAPVVSPSGVPSTSAAAPGPAPYVPAFERFQEEVRARARLLASCLASAKLVQREEGRILVSMPKLSPFQKAQFDTPASQKILADAATAAFSGGAHPVRVEFVVMADAPPPAEPAAGRGPLADPILDKVIELFDGKVVDVDRSGRRSD